jgi:hypothetical protein
VTDRNVKEHAEKIKVQNILVGSEGHTLELGNALEVESVHM